MISSTFVNPTQGNHMKKSLIALAVLAASGAAMAQSSVTLYGIADVVVHKDKGVSTKMTSGGVSTSRWGIKGSEDLGGGLAANFLFEQAIDLTNGGTAGGFDRQAYVGFSGGFGEVKLGNVYTAFDDISAAAAPTFDSNVLDPSDVFVSNNYTFSPGSNIYYSTPSFGGFSGAVSYALGGANDKVASYHAKYENGPLFVGLGYQDDSKAGGDKYTRLNGTYDFGVAKLLVAYGKTKTADVTDLSIGADVPLAANLVLSAGYASAKPDGAARRSSYGLAVVYSLSKRTSVYTGLRNDNAAAVANGGVDSRFGVGVKHTF
jgi:predicted porin